MVNSSQNEILFKYYDERAPEYEDAYRGNFFREVPNPALYQKDTEAIQKLLPDYVKGKCLDIACGTGFWLPFYEKNCREITLIDQSDKVLAECAGKIKRLGIKNKTELIKGDLFTYKYPRHAYDSAVIGFLISHLKEAELDSFFRVLRTVLAPSGTFVIIDNIWDYARKQLRKNKAGMIKRQLNDGREFEIYKRYFSQKDVRSLEREYQFKLEIVYWGRVFFLTAGKLQRIKKA